MKCLGAHLINASLMASVLDRVARGKWKQGCHFLHCLIRTLLHVCCAVSVLCAKMGTAVWHKGGGLLKIYSLFSFLSRVGLGLVFTNE